MSLRIRQHDDDTHPRRKVQQVRVCLEKNVQFKEITTGLERYRFIHNALPEIDAAAVDTSTQLFGRTLSAPLLISPMTGGTESARAINRRLAVAAQRLGLAMGVGSQRAAVHDSALAVTYQVRDVAPDILLFANLGAVQLNYGFGLHEARAVVEMIGADALVLHLNPLHEALQPAGDTDFRDLLPKIGAVCAGLRKPVIVKEVGYGISEQVARRLRSVGVAGIDVAGAGGTAWGEVERHRLKAGQRRVAAAFANWGIPTAESVQMVRSVDHRWPVIASGGIRTGVDVAKCLALGADTVGIALPLLKPATTSQDTVIERLEDIIRELRLTMFVIGVRTIAELKKSKLEKV